MLRAWTAVKCNQLSHHLVLYRLANSVFHSLAKMPISRCMCVDVEVLIVAVCLRACKNSSRLACETVSIENVNVGSVF